MRQFWPPPRDLTPRQEWTAIGVGWAWLVAEFVGAAVLLMWIGPPH